jgi:hypothetical protein
MPVSSTPLAVSFVKDARITAIRFVEVWSFAKMKTEQLDQYVSDYLSTLIGVRDLGAVQVLIRGWLCKNALETSVVFTILRSFRV